MFFLGRGGGGPQRTFRRGRRVSERHRGLLNVAWPLRVGAWRAACRKLLLLHTNYCSFATGEQQLAARHSSEYPRQTRQICRPRGGSGPHAPSEVKPRDSSCPPVCPVTLLSEVFLESEFPKVSAGTSSQEMERAHWGPPGRVR